MVVSICCLLSSMYGRRCLASEGFECSASKLGSMAEAWSSKETDAACASALTRSYEALEAEAEDRRRALRLITAARAGRVVKRQQSASPVRRSEQNPPNVLFAHPHWPCFN